MTLKIASLLEIMNAFNVSHLLAALNTMRCLEDVARRMCDEGKAETLVKDHAGAQETLNVALRSCARICNDIELGRAHMRLVGELQAPDHAGILTFSQLQRQIPEFLEDVSYDLMFRRFAYVERDKAVKHDKFVKEWHPILEGFPESAAECSDGMDCYALGLYTAGVFHSMRVAEFGLRRLAKKLQVKITDKGQTVPIEFGDWQKVLQAIKSKIAQTRSIPKNSKRDKRLTAYSEMADHCEYMKDYWRNPSSHCRKRYNEGECLGALERVRSFMLLLVTALEVKK